MILPQNKLLATTHACDDTNVRHMLFTFKLLFDLQVYKHAGVVYGGIF